MVAVERMMHEVEIAFVIKRFLPQKQKVSLLTRSLGRINVIVMPLDICERLWPGMMVAATIVKEGGRCIAHNITIIATSGASDYEGIRWLHHICELCYYFLPAESPCVDIFFYMKRSCLLLTRLELFDRGDKEIVKKIGVTKFLSAVGFYDSTAIRDCLPLFYDITAPSVDFADGLKVESLKQRLECVKESEMDAWILECLKSHPLFHLFKTVVFNYNV